MIPIHGKPLLEYIIDGLRSVGFKSIILVVGYRKEQIIDYFQKGDQWGINIEYVVQKKLNGTGGALLLCEKLIKTNHFLLTWGDVLVPYDVYRKTVELHRKEHQDFVLVANYTDDPSKGAAIHSINKYCDSIIEKPKKDEAKSNLNNCGVFILHKMIFKELKNLKPSKRGEIELTDALQNGITEKKWKIRLMKMEKGEFRADFGDKEIYELLVKDSTWLEQLTRSDERYQ
jgi:bifunctional UDP-N-acetylglucosamine pyrophosphorylase/glucosamine-1-phosphate N-acetyltransferase